jgi:hypothetical protein
MPYCSLLMTKAAIYEAMGEWNASLEIFRLAFSCWRAKHGTIGSEPTVSTTLPPEMDVQRPDDVQR